MNLYIEGDIRVHYEQRQEEWRQRMHTMLQRETPTPTAQLLDEVHDYGVDNDSYDDPLSQHGSEWGMSDGSVSPSAEAEAGRDDEEIWTPLTGWIGVSVNGSSISSQGIETPETHSAEPLISQADTSGSSTDSRTPGFQSKRPASHILLNREREKEATNTPSDGQEKEEDVSMLYRTERPMSERGGSSSDGETSRRRGTVGRDVNGSAPWTQGPDLRDCNNDSSDDDYNEDPVDLWALRQHRLGSHRRPPE